MMLTYYNVAENPIKLWIVDPTIVTNGGLIDFSVGYTFVVKIGNPGSAAILTKSTGIAGAAGAGVEPTGTPNLVITPTADEFAALSGVYNIQLKATSGGNDTLFQDTIQILQVIT
jgi:hypothetical protein